MKKLALQYLVAAYGPDKLNDPTQAEPIVQEMIRIAPNDPGNYFALARIYEDAGRYEEAEAALLKARDTNPQDVTVYVQLSGFYNRQGQFDKTMEALHKAADINPNDPQGHQLVVGYYQDRLQKDRKDNTLTPAQKKDYIEKGLAAGERALALNPDYIDAHGLPQHPAPDEGERWSLILAKRKALYDEADRLRNRAMELTAKKTGEAKAAEGKK